MSRDEVWVQRLRELGQDHIVDDPEVDLDAVIEQLKNLGYPGGVEAYLKNARGLLEDAEKNVDPFANYAPEQPPTNTVNIDENVEELLRLEAVGEKEALGRTGFVLVAGGLGERLGYSDIKVDLYTQTVEPMSHLAYYAASIRTSERKTNKTLPLFIMTSGDTHELTMATFEKNNWFGLKRDQVSIVMQEKVPALLDAAGHIALSEDKRSVVTKPHGHGDVHQLLLGSGVLERWIKEYGTEYLFFFQDTNCLAFRALSALLGASVEQGLAMNSLGIERKNCEAVGAICKLVSTRADESGTKSGGLGQELVVNVEYNQLDSMLKRSGHPNGDSGTGISPYPGNCNILLLRVSDYMQALRKCNGIVPEFVNPKYTDGSRTAFKTPTRVECMMQDIPRVFTPSQVHGCTVFPRWFCFTTIKNNSQDAAVKVTPECAFSAEQDLYYNARRCVQLLAGEAAATACQEPKPATFLGVEYNVQPRVWISPESAVSLSDISKILKKRGNVRGIEFTHDSVFVIDPQHDGENVILPQPKELGAEELSSAEPNYRVRGYRPVKTLGQTRN